MMPSAFYSFDRNDAVGAIVAVLVGSLAFVVHKWRSAVADLQSSREAFSKKCGAAEAQLNVLKERLDESRAEVLKRQESSKDHKLSIKDLEAEQHSILQDSHRFERAALEKDDTINELKRLVSELKSDPQVEAAATEMVTELTMLRKKVETLTQENRAMEDKLLASTQQLDKFLARERQRFNQEQRLRQLRSASRDHSS
jgi:chromosome segregation ATPase